MGNVGSRPEDGSPLMLRDQARLVVTSVKITRANNRLLYTILPNAYPSTRYMIRKEDDNENVVEYIQDPETTNTSAPPNFLIKLHNDEDIHFYFTFTVRPASGTAQSNNDLTRPAVAVDTVINSLTFVSASTQKDLETLVTREFNADPNLHRNPNVDLVGDYATAGQQQEHFEWSWKWRPPKQEKDKGGGWRNTCGFVEYDQRAHRLNTLVTFSFWVHHAPRALDSPVRQSPQRGGLTVPRSIRIPSAQSIESRMSDSRMSDSDTEFNQTAEPTPLPPESIPEYGPMDSTSQGPGPFKVDINCRPGDDISQVEDGPVFRATLKALESKSGSMRSRMKKVLKKAEFAKEAQVAANIAFAAFTESLREASNSNVRAIQPAMDHYFEKIATEILNYEKQNAENLQRLIIDPLYKLYTNEIKQVDSKKKDFEDESRDYYAYVGRYLGQRNDSLKEKKRTESDTKYQSKRKTFELKRFDYSSFMQDLHGGRKDQEVLSQLTRYADQQARGYLDTAKKVEALLPQLDALYFEVKEADKEYQLLRTGREEKRRALEKIDKSNIEADSPAVQQTPTLPSGAFTENEISAATNLTPAARMGERPRSGIGIPINGAAQNMPTDMNSGASPPSNLSIVSSSPSQDRFKGFRDLEENKSLSTSNSGDHRKEGLLWALSKPGSHADPKGINKQAWHKYWIVVDKGIISEYINWKQNPEQHRSPIDLRVASVREARNSERRFCFEVITPDFTRVYQATSEDDMRSWIQAINNALQSAFESRSEMAVPHVVRSASGKGPASIARDLFGKGPSLHGHRSTSSTSHNHFNRTMGRHATVGDRPPMHSRQSSEDTSGRLLQSLREADAGNAWCADCGSDSRVEWVSINLAIILCIECGGIHRSLGTHISKIRSLTLDTTSFTQDLVELLSQVGNRVSNMVWEATLAQSSAMSKINQNASREQRLRFITAKYVDRAFIKSLSTSSRYHTPEETLLAAIKTNDLQSVLHALSLKASPNSLDRMRSVHAVFLALAAADPASPGSITPSTISDSPKAGTQMPRKSFAIAELLVQNGADIPSTPPPFPLSRSAQAYLDFKHDQKHGRATLGHSKSTTGVPSSPYAYVPRSPMREAPPSMPTAGSTITSVGPPSAYHGATVVPVGNAHIGQAGQVFYGTSAPPVISGMYMGGGRAGTTTTTYTGQQADPSRPGSGRAPEDEITALPRFETAATTGSGNGVGGEGVAGGGMMGGRLHRGASSDGRTAEEKERSPKLIKRSSIRSAATLGLGKG